jgi:hypothetical protein
VNGAANDDTGIVEQPYGAIAGVASGIAMYAWVTQHAATSQADGQVT